MNTQQTRAHLVISGRVQGVAFRYYTRRQAQALGLTGWVRNQPDGRVEVLVEGRDAEVEAMIEWCHHGPPSAMVTNVEITRSQASGQFPSFDITF